METPDKPVGAFFASLKRTNREIKNDRAVAISESAQLLLRRTVEDLQMERKTLVRDREGLLDLSPTNALSLVVTSDFNAKNFVDKYLDLGLKIRNLDIKLEIAQSAYKTLFEEVQPVEA